MKAIVYEKNGPPEVLEYRDVDDPVLTAGQVLIRTHAICVEGGDLIARRSMPIPVIPYIGGYQRAGVIEAIASDVEGLQIGQRVTAFYWSGAYAELSTVPAHYVYPIPDNMEFDIAVTIPVTFGTAAEAMLHDCTLASGETVLITGATGGVGLAAVQLAKNRGATVIGTSSSDQHLDALKALGMDFGINYRSRDVGKECKALTGGKGVDLSIDNIGGSMTDSIVAASAVGGRISIVGSVADPAGSKYNCMDLIRKQLSAKGTFFGMHMHTPRARKMINDLIVDVNDGKYEMPIDRKFSLERMVDAHRYIETSQLFGRIVLSP